MNEKPFQVQNIHLRTQGTRVDCTLGCATFGPKLVSSNHLTKENSSIHFAVFLICIIINSDDSMALKIHPLFLCHSIPNCLDLEDKMGMPDSFDNNCCRLSLPVPVTPFLNPSLWHVVVYKCSLLAGLIHTINYRPYYGHI